jgi:hypothetical protein
MSDLVVIQIAQTFFEIYCIFLHLVLLHANYISSTVHCHSAIYSTTFLHDDKSAEMPEEKWKLITKQKCIDCIVTYVKLYHKQFKLY